MRRSGALLRAGWIAVSVRVVAMMAAVLPMTALVAQGGPPVRARAAIPTSLPTVVPRPGMVITHSVRVKPGVYRWAGSASLDSALLVIRGSGITVDMRGVVLVGTPDNAEPDAARGVAVRIDGGSGVRVQGLRARGYHVGILARGTRSLELLDNDLSHNWKPRLFSLVEHESLNDWLSYHQNEQREWLRFGAGIYLEGVIGGALRGNRVEQGMNGLMLVRTDSLQIRANDFSFNSGLGIGMYRSSHNTIVANRIDYDVRGYSHGVYRRGQDSAGILMFEQCTGNMVAYNSVTHGGDGLFLWAGQQTMDNGKGGANDNVFLSNDFSYAPTNGMEATFSRNSFIANRVVGNDHGLWGGYSYESRVIGNCFGANRIGIAIEHGQQNTIAANRFDGDGTGIRLWADPIEPSDWGYPKFRDTRSRDNLIRENRMNGVKTPFAITNTAPLDTIANIRADSIASDCDPRRLAPTTTYWRLPKIDDEPLTWPRTAVADRDRSAIVVDEWGPYDWRSPKLWPVDSTRAMPLRLAVLGPAGRWRVVGQRGLTSVSSRSGRVGDTIVVTPASVAIGDWSLTLEYVGTATRSRDGVEHRAGTPVRFSYERFEPAARWNVRFYAWADSTDPRARPDAFDALLRSPPLLTRDELRLDYFTSRALFPSLPRNKLALEATSSLTLPAGTHTLRTLSDDAVRVWIDDVLVIDDWLPHVTRPAYAAIAGGTHRVRVQYVQVDGWSELRLDVLRGVQSRSMGSDGPH